MRNGVLTGTRMRAHAPHFVAVWCVLLAFLSVARIDADCSFVATKHTPLNGDLGTCGSGGNLTAIPDQESCNFNCTAGFTLLGSALFCNGTNLEGGFQTCSLVCEPQIFPPDFGSLGTCGEAVVETRTCDFTCDAYYSLSGDSWVCECDPETLVCEFTGTNQTCDYQTYYGDFWVSEQGVIGASVGMVCLALIIALLYVIRYFSSPAHRYVARNNIHKTQDTMMLMSPKPATRDVDDAKQQQKQNTETVAFHINV